MALGHLAPCLALGTYLLIFWKIITDRKSSSHSKLGYSFTNFTKKFRRTKFWCSAVLPYENFKWIYIKLSKLWNFTDVVNNMESNQSGPKISLRFAKVDLAHVRQLCRSAPASVKFTSVQPSASFGDYWLKIIVSIFSLKIKKVTKTKW